MVDFATQDRRTGDTKQIGRRRRRPAGDAARSRRNNRRSLSAPDDDGLEKRTRHPARPQPFGYGLQFLWENPAAFSFGASPPMRRSPAGEHDEGRERFFTAERTTPPRADSLKDLFRTVQALRAKLAKKGSVRGSFQWVGGLDLSSDLDEDQAQTTQAETRGLPAFALQFLVTCCQRNTISGCYQGRGKKTTGKNRRWSNN